MTDTPVFERTLARRLARTRATTHATMILERAWPLALPLLVIASLFLSLSWLGVFRLLPDVARFGLLALLGLAFLALLVPLRRYRSPTADEVDRRLEGFNRLAHTPLLVQSDQPTGAEDGFSRALWREHQKRMAARLGELGADLPRTSVPARDPWGLRVAAALLLVSAFAFSFGPLGGRLGDGFRAGAVAAPLAPRIDAWVTPPVYTGRPPIFLSAAAAAAPVAPVLTVPQGSDVVVRVHGGSGEERLVFTDTAGLAREMPPAATTGDDKPAAATSPSRKFAGKLEADGILALTTGKAEVESWAFSVIADKPPSIRFVDEPKRAANGALELRYEISDDYGAASARSEFVLDEPQDDRARPLYAAPEMPLTLPRRSGKDKAAKVTRELTEHVWAGSTVRVTLKAADDAGQQAVSETKTFRLPERPFTNPLARAVVEWRKIFALDANQVPRVLGLIDAVTLRPEDTFENDASFLGIMSARTRLTMAHTDEQLREVADYLWEIALRIEDGALSSAEKRLRQAQEALKQALENGASDEEIDGLMAELREAMNEFMRELAERSQQNPNDAQPMPPNAQELRQSDLQKMMDQIENLAKSGNRDKAQELLAELQEMMNNLQTARRQPGQQGQQSEMRQQMDKLGELMRRQQEMMNETFRMDQRQRGEQGKPGENGEQGQQGQQGEGQQGSPMTPEEFAEAMKRMQQGQGQLQQDLEALTKALEGMGVQPGEGFGEAGEAMGEAKGALGEGQGDRAVGQQGRALEALRQGAQDMMSQMQAMQGDEGGNQEGGRQQNSDRDPLGRPRATSGPDFGDSVQVPDEIDVQRARQILEAIRKRLGNALSPELERSYLERLLEPR